MFSICHFKTVHGFCTFYPTGEHVPSIHSSAWETVSSYLQPCCWFVKFKGSAAHLVVLMDASTFWNYVELFTLSNPRTILEVCSMSASSSVVRPSSHSLSSYVAPLRPDKVPLILPVADLSQGPLYLLLARKTMPPPMWYLIWIENVGSFSSTLCNTASSAAPQIPLCECWAWTNVTQIYLRLGEHKFQEFPQ